MIENHNSNKENNSTLPVEDVESSLLQSYISQYKTEPNNITDIPTEKNDTSETEKNVTIENESSSQENVIVEGFKVQNSALEKAGLDPLSFKNELRETYAKTDKLLHEKLEKSFEILENREEAKKRMKQDFFDKILLLLLFLAISPMLIMYLFKDSSSASTFAVSIISAMVELFAGIIILPKIIAQYLFDKDEDKIYFNLIKDLRDYHISKKDDIGS